jgi:hypothetical protein
MGSDDTRRDADERVARRWLDSARPLLWGALAVVVVGLVAGIVFSQADPRHAASLMLGSQVTTEPEGEATSGPAPTSGRAVGTPTCGIQSRPVAASTQVAALRAGIVVVQYRDTADAEAVVEALASRSDDVLVAPNRDLTSPVVATAWGRRLRLPEVDGQLLRAFVTAHAGIGPAVTDCPA